MRQHLRTAWSRLRPLLARNNLLLGLAAGVFGTAVGHLLRGDRVAATAYLALALALALARRTPPRSCVVIVHHGEPRHPGLHDAIERAARTSWMAHRRPPYVSDAVLAAALAFGLSKPPPPRPPDMRLRHTGSTSD